MATAALEGALAGLAATAPMTVAMEFMHRRLPCEQQHPLPPRHITMNMAASIGLDHEMDESQRSAATLAGHFAYGAACGAIYAPLMRRVPLPPVAKGIGFGLAVWAVSYMGWLPAAGLFPPARSQPASRNALMIAAHVVWGAATGWIDEMLTITEREGAFSRQRDQRGRQCPTPPR